MPSTPCMTLPGEVWQSNYIEYWSSCPYLMCLMAPIILANNGHLNLTRFRHHYAVNQISLQSWRLESLWRTQKALDHTSSPTSLEPSTCQVPWAITDPSALVLVLRCRRWTHEVLNQCQVWMVWLTQLKIAIYILHKVIITGIR